MLSMNQKILPRIVLENAHLRFFRFNYVSMANDHECDFKPLNAPKVAFLQEKLKIFEFSKLKIGACKD